MRAGKKDIVHHKINDEISSESVMLIGSDGAAVGVMPLTDALGFARGQGLDLVEMAVNDGISVCKALSYSKYKYETQKKRIKKGKRSHRSSSAVKEVRLRPGIGHADYLVKFNKVLSFLKEGHRVVVSMRLVGREIFHPEVGMKHFENMLSGIEGIASVESPPSKRDVNNYVMILRPQSRVGHESHFVEDSHVEDSQAPKHSDSEKHDELES